MEPVTLNRGNTLFLMIDLQEKLMPAIEGAEQIAAAAERLLRAASALDIPLIVTEQYPKGLGGTVEPLRSLMASAAPLPKTAFSCAGAEGFSEAFERIGRNRAVLWGVETHICVFTTAMELAKKGCQVVVAGEACGSRKKACHDLAVASMLAAGIAVLPVETVVYQLLGRAGTPEFKALLPYFK